MLKSDLLELIKDKGDAEDIDDIISPKYLNLDLLKDKSKNDKDIKSWLDSEKDKHHSKALDTWKTNNGKEYAVDTYYELYPDSKPKDPKDLEIEKLKREIADKEKKNEMEALKARALKELSDKKLPIELVDKLIGKDENTTLENITTFNDIILNVVTNTKKEVMKDNVHIPPGGGSGGSSSTNFIDIIKENQVKRD